MPQAHLSESNVILFSAIERETAEALLRSPRVRAATKHLLQVAPKKFCEPKYKEYREGGKLYSYYTEDISLEANRKAKKLLRETQNLEREDASRLTKNITKRAKNASQT